MALPSESTSSLGTQAKELMKQYIVYDDTSRPQTIYTAYYKAASGAPCTRVDYEYLNSTSPQVLKMRESIDVWDASYDI